MNRAIEFLRKQIGRPIQNSPSPVSLWLGTILRYVDENKITADFVVRHEMTNPLKTLHGGMFSLIIDEMIGYAVYALGPKNIYVSVNLTVDFLHPAHEGETITATTQINRAGKTIINADCFICNANGVLLAKGHSNLAATSLPNHLI